MYIKEINLVKLRPRPTAKPLKTETSPRYPICGQPSTQPLLALTRSLQNTFRYFNPQAVVEKCFLIILSLHTDAHETSATTL